MDLDESMHLLSADPSASPSSFSQSQSPSLSSSSSHSSPAMATEDNSPLPAGSDPAAAFQTSILDHISTKRAVWVATLLALGNMADAVQIMSVGFILAEMDEIPRIQKGNEAICHRLISCLS